MGLFPLSHYGLQCLKVQLCGGNWQDRGALPSSSVRGNYILGCTSPAMWGGQFDCKGHVSDHNMTREGDKHLLITDQSSVVRLPYFSSV